MALLLLVSGGCALVFQVVWMRDLRLVFGATTAASAAVLAIFMAGLGLGNALLGPRIDRAERPVRFYGLLEAGVAASAALSPLLVDAAQAAYIALGGQASLGATLATLARLVATAAVLAVPTFLMGGTLPAAARAISLDADVQRRGVALVYGLNTLGAVLGAGLATFMLLESLGGRAALWSACGVNLLLSAAALLLSRRLCAKPSKKLAARHAAARRHARMLEEDGAPHAPRRPPSLAAVCLAAGVVGFAFFLMEIVWYRMLGPLLGGTTYTFGLILCVALLGIGLGGAAYSVAARRLTPSLTLFALTCAVEAALIAAPYWYGDGIALWVLHQQSLPVDSFAQQVWNWLQVAGFVILPAALVAGFQFPLLIAVAGSGREHVGKHVGWTVAANTAGAIVGSITGGFFLLPLLSAPGAWQLVVAMLVGLALVIALAGDMWRQQSLAIAAAAAAALAIFGVCQRGPTAFWRHSGLGAGREKLEDISRNDAQELMHLRRRQCIWEAEGVESSVAIMATDSLSFVVNGKADGNAIFDAGTQIGLGLVGPLLCESPRTALVVGLGTGESAGWLADVKSISSVDVIELEPAVVEMARRCAASNRSALENPKLRLHFNDAREFLLTSGQDYDLIVSEPSNPYRAGIASLYTREFYQAVADRLSDEGLLLQWLQGYEVDERTVRIVMHTLRSVFPSMQVWRTRSRDLLFVCGKSADVLEFDADTLRRRMADPAIADGLRYAWRAVDVEGVLAHYVCGQATIEEFLDDARQPRDALPLNTDDRNVLEYAFAKTVGQPTRFSTQDLLSAASKLDDDCPVPAPRSIRPGSPGGGEA
jgi:spermidine synthase